MSEAIITMGLAAMKGNDTAQALIDALRAILPYAESRAEDMDDACDRGDPHDVEITAKAVAAVDAAKALLASLEAADAAS